MPMFQRVVMKGGKEEATPTSISIFDSYDMKTLVISLVASKYQDFKVGMPVFQPFYVMRL